MYQMDPREIVRAGSTPEGWPDFVTLMHFAAAAERQNGEALSEMIGRASKDDMGPGIASAVAVGVRAGK
jgi:hypothetical protein